jgi:hypothetical protein
MVVVILFFMLMVEYCAATNADVSCEGGDGSIPDPNACAGIMSGGGDPLPNCMNVAAGDGAIPLWICARCSHNCDCPIGYYCSKGPGRTSGSCCSLHEEERIGQTCMEFGVPGTTGAIIPTMGYNDRLVCGSPIFSGNGTFLRYDWLGACVGGICKEWDGGMVPWSVVTAWTTMIPSSISIPAQDGIDGWLGRDGGSLTCVQRFCRDGVLSEDMSWVYRLVSSHEISAATLGLVATITIILIILLCAACCSRDFLSLCLKRKTRSLNSHQEL